MNPTPLDLATVVELPAFVGAAAVYLEQTNAPESVKAQARASLAELQRETGTMLALMGRAESDDAGDGLGFLSLILFPKVAAAWRNYVVRKARNSIIARAEAQRASTGADRVPDGSVSIDEPAPPQTAGAVFVPDDVEASTSLMDRLGGIARWLQTRAAVPAALQATRTAMALKRTTQDLQRAAVPVTSIASIALPTVTAQVARGARSSLETGAKVAVMSSPIGAAAMLATKAPKVVGSVLGAWTGMNLIALPIAAYIAYRLFLKR